MRWRRESGDARPVDEHQAFSSGRYVEFLLGEGEIIPDWAWVNGVARGDDNLVAALAFSELNARSTPAELQRWLRVRKALAMEVMNVLVVGRCTLEELQREVLVGVELELAATTDWALRGPADIATVVLDALSSFRARSQQRPGGDFRL